MQTAPCLRSSRLLIEELRDLSHRRKISPLKANIVQPVTGTSEGGIKSLSGLISHHCVDPVLAFGPVTNRIDIFPNDFTLGCDLEKMSMASRTSERITIG